VSLATIYFNNRGFPFGQVTQTGINATINITVGALQMCIEVGSGYTHLC